MTNREQCLIILNGMVDRGYNLMGRTAEQMVDMMSADLEFFKNAAQRFDRWNSERG